jgi:glycerol-3-phosphate acyltransferase PlsX
VQPIAVDVMGTDNGPTQIVAGARQAAEDLGIPVVLVGRPDALVDTGSLEVVAASEVIAMGEDAASSVRRKKDASVVRAAELVRDGKASAMVCPGNTGAAMGSALLRLGRLPGVSRPAIATPLPVPGSTPTVLLDAGANAECQPGWLVQFAQMGAAYAAGRYGITTPRVGLLSIGEEDTKGSDLVKEANALLRNAAVWEGSGGTFVGNVEGRDLLSDRLDVVVTDGFTGNVVLKTLEGAMGFMRRAVVGALTATEEAAQASQRVLPLLVPLAAEMDPDSYGGALLLGVDGVCIISHGSSSSAAIVNAVRAASELVEQGLVDRLRRSVKG